MIVLIMWNGLTLVIQMIDNSFLKRCRSCQIWKKAIPIHVKLNLKSNKYIKKLRVPVLYSIMRLLLYIHMYTIKSRVLINIFWNKGDFFIYDRYTKQTINKVHVVAYGRRYFRNKIESGENIFQSSDIDDVFIILIFDRANLKFNNLNSLK